MNFYDFTRHKRGQISNCDTSYGKENLKELL